MTLVYLPHLGASVALQSGTLGGNTSGASTFFGSNVVLAGGSNVTLQASSDTVYIHGASGGGGGSGAGTDWAITGGSITVNTSGGTISLPAYLTTAAPPGAYLTTAAQSNHSHAFATTSTAGASIVVGTSNSAGVTIGVPAYLTTAGATNAITTARASNDAVGLATAATSVTWTVNSAGISLNAGAYLTTAANSTHSHGNPTLALTNLSGTTGSASNGFTLSLSAAAAGAGGGATVNGSTGNVSIVAGANITLNTAGSTISIVGPSPGGGGAPSRRFIEIMNGERFTTIANLSQTNLSNRVLLFPFWVDGTDITPKTVRFLITGIGSSNRSLGGTYDMGLYSLANDTQAQLWASDRVTLSITASSQSTVWNGFRALDFTGLSGSTMTNEGRWVLALRVSNVSNNATWANVAIYGGDPMPAFSGYLINGTSASTNASQQIFPFWGAYSATTGSLPGTINLTQVNGMASASNLDVYAIIKEI